MSLKEMVINVTEKYRLVQQELVLKQYNTACLKLRIAFANCEAQIGWILKQHNPDLYKIRQWEMCRDEIRTRLETNQQTYDRYVQSLHGSSGPCKAVFEEEPPSHPSLDEMSPIQGYTEVLLGRVARGAARTTQPTPPSTLDTALPGVAATLNVNSHVMSPTTSAPQSRLPGSVPITRIPQDGDNPTSPPPLGRGRRARGGGHHAKSISPGLAVRDTTPPLPPALSNTCVICLEPLNKGPVFTSPGCSHFFHEGCVDLWYSGRDFSCPSCGAGKASTARGRKREHTIHRTTLYN